MTRSERIERAAKEVARLWRCGKDTGYLSPLAWAIDKLENEIFFGRRRKRFPFWVDKYSLEDPRKESEG